MNDDGSPTRKNGKTSSSPKDANGFDGAGSGADSNAGGNNGGVGGKKGRHLNGRDPTMVELKKKAAAMIEYITQSQGELARWSDRGPASVLLKLPGELPAAGEPTDEITRQMSELNAQLARWQEEYGKWPDK